MKFVYPAIIRKNESGKYDAFFPDLECCSACGDTLEEAVDMANEAAYDWLYVELMEDDGQLPPVSDREDMDLLEGDVVRNIAVNIRFTEGWDE
ncbi:MAG: type II toxin-antitoxin system HicB family antitoxin [Ruminococcus sp.]|jgi:predicted RNase H-like HicB family nuclease